MSTSRVLILHGWGGSDAPHWQAKYAGEIAQKYGCVYFPLLDNPHFPTKNRWLKQLRNIMDWYKPDTIIAHSLGCILWFWYANEYTNEKITNLILVAPPRVDCQIDTISTFFPAPIPLTLCAKKSWLIVSDNDKYLDIQEATKLSQALQIKPIVIHNGGHINGESGHGKLGELEDILLEIL